MPYSDNAKQDKPQNLAIRLLRVLRYNKARIERTISLLPDEHKPLFNVLPFLLHVNHPKMPGYIAESDAPYGLCNFTLRPSVSDALEAIFPNISDITEFAKKAWPKKRYIESVLLMGSVGTIAQDEHSDFDYWVCINGRQYSDYTLNLLQQKLSRIEKWAEKFFDLEVHFFISDIDRVCSNDFGIADGESAGSAQAVFLKAEFYTTNIVVAGKAPFWWLTPNNTSDQQYEKLYRSLKKSKSFDPKWVMDLGNLEKMDPSELFGAAIWQLSKAMDSPFKSVLKMAKLEVFLENIDSHQPLCNTLKQYVHQTDENSGNVEPIDPYALMFDQLINHYTLAEKPAIVKLLQECLYIKCDSQLSMSVSQYGRTFKHQIMAVYVAKWGWSEDKVRQFDNLDTWTFAQHAALSKRIHSFLIQCYRRMSAKFKTLNHTVSKQDMTVLGRRLETYYAKKTNKITMLRSGFGEELYCPVVTIRPKRQKQGQRQWTVYAGDQLTALDKDIKQYKVYTCASIPQLITWCVVNKIIDTKTTLLLDYDSDPVTEDDLRTLTRVAYKRFKPIKINAIPRRQLLDSKQITNCLVTLNFESSRLKAHADSIATLYTTSWGEHFIEYGRSAFDTIMDACLAQDNAPELYFSTPNYTHQKRLQEAFIEMAPEGFKHLD